MSKNCEIMKRMKSSYEQRSRTFLTRRTPVIIRIDGKTFSTYTKGLEKPFDEGLMDDMIQTTKFLCENIQGAKLGYTQSDEISILVTDYDKLTSQAWFDYAVQKMTSISASLATARFNELRTIRSVVNNMDVFYSQLDMDFAIRDTDLETKGKFDHKSRAIQSFTKVLNVLDKAYFDSRVFNIPKEEVANYFLARQKDAVKNSIAMLAQSLYSHRELENKNGNQMQEMCFQKGQNWNDLDFGKKRGTTVIKKIYVNGLTDDSILSKKDAEVRGIYLTTDWGIFSEDSGEYEPVENPTIRSKWEAVETPMKFDHEYFDRFVKIP